MNAQDMLDYAFGLLESPRLEPFELALARDPALEDRVARLRRAVNTLVDDGETHEHPEGLATRTCEVVERRRQRPALLDFVPSRVPFRWSDLAVAATVFLAALATLSAPLMKSRAQAEQAMCALNLSKLGVGLSKYSATHGSYPFVPVSFPAGTYAVMLHDAHDLPDPSILACPCASQSGHAKPIPDMIQFRDLVQRNPDECTKMLNSHYAYNIGYRPHPAATAKPVPDAAEALLPIASDGPNHEDGHVREGNSLNHGGGGQNVLFCDGHVSWRRTRWVSNVDRDLFRNEANRPTFGLHSADSVLVHSTAMVPDH